MVKTVAVGTDQVIAGGNGALVSSKSEPGAWHIVKNGVCDCKGYQYRGRCRHLDAARQADAEARESRLAVVIAKANATERAARLAASLDELQDLFPIY